MVATEVEATTAGHCKTDHLYRAVQRVRLAVPAPRHNQRAKSADPNNNDQNKARPVREPNLVATVLNENNESQENQDSPVNQKLPRNPVRLKTRQAMRSQEATVRNEAAEAEETRATEGRKTTRMEATNLLPIRLHEKPVLFSSFCARA